ncbi:hypothetical protein GCM10011490_18010 [Pseudoclavibacter endophyticus]|nr:type II/IV secretion system ATPase subunit [Pseudoclavibacter endophyticus]GGA67827.1 hypothetical protein GCM10011490_18010 [Pseudoclavibacter endophyticus]
MKQWPDFDGVDGERAGRRRSRPAATRGDHRPPSPAGSAPGPGGDTVGDAAASPTTWRPRLPDGGINSLPLFMTPAIGNRSLDELDRPAPDFPGTAVVGTDGARGAHGIDRRADRGSPDAATTPAGPETHRATERVDWDIVQRLRRAVSTLLTQAMQDDPAMTEELQRANAQAHIAEVIRSHVDDQIAVGGAAAAWTPSTRTLVAQSVFDALFKLGRLQPLVDDPTVENIDIYGFDTVWVSHADGTRRRHEPIARSDAELIADIAFLAQRSGEDGRSFTPSTPILDMDLPGNARLAAVHPPISPRPKVVVRIHRFVDISLDDLVAVHGALTADAASFLDAAVRAGLSIVVAGAPGAGKTTLVRALANCIPPHEEIVTIEKERELHLDRMGDRHHIVTPLQFRPGQGEGGSANRLAGEVTLVDLIEEALRLNAERIIVGEVRGDEVDAMFQAMQAGVGSLSTIHAHSPTDTIERLAGLALKSLGTTDAYAYRQIARHIDLIVQVRRVRDHRGRLHRRITHIAEVQPGEESRDGVARPIAADIYVRHLRDAALRPVALPTGATLEALEEAGFDRAHLRGDRGERGEER